MTEGAKNEHSQICPAAKTGGALAILVDGVGLVGLRGCHSGRVAVLLEVSEVKFESFTTPCKEVFVEGHGISVTVNTWSNSEGLSFMVNGKDSAIRTAGCMRWEELDVLLCALTAARSS